MNRKKITLSFIVTVLLTVLVMAGTVLASDAKCGVDDGAVRRTKEEVNASKTFKEILDEGIEYKAVPNDNIKVEGIENPFAKQGVDDGAVRRTKEEVEGKCFVDDGAVRRTKEEMGLQNNAGLTKDQKVYVGVMAGLFGLTLILSLYIMFGKTKDYEPMQYEKTDDDK